MNKGVRVILRKQIRDAEMISGFEKLSGLSLPNPPCEVPKEQHVKVLTWQFHLLEENAVEEYKELLDLFQLPYKTNGVDIVHCKMIRYGWYDVIFEVHEWDDLYQQMRELGYV